MRLLGVTLWTYKVPNSRAYVYNRVVSRQPAEPPPPDLNEIRRSRQMRVSAVPAAASPLGDHAAAYISAGDVAALLNRIGECVRALPAYGRPPTLGTGAAAKRMLSAISTCSPDRLAEDDPLHAVLLRIDATRRDTNVSYLSGAQRIAAERWVQGGVNDLADADQPKTRALPSHAYVLWSGHVIRRSSDDPADDPSRDDADASCDELVRDLTLAGALIACEIDRLQQLQCRPRRA